MDKFKERLLEFLPFLACYLCLAFAFPPYKLGLLVPVILAPLFKYSLELSYKKVIIYTYISSFVFNGLMYYWISHVMELVPGPIVAIGLFALLTYLSCYYVIGFCLFKYLWGKNLWWLFPWVWVGIEVSRSRGEISFPWSHLAFTLGDYTSIIQIISIVGISGLSALIIYLNLFLLKYWQSKKVEWLIIFIIPMVMLASYGTYRLDNKEFGEEKAELLLIQPFIEQSTKWKKENYEFVVQNNFDMLQSANHKNKDLIVFPETSIPAYLNLKHDLSLRYKKTAHNVNSNIIVGSLNFDKNGPAARNYYNYYNAAYLFNKDNYNVEIYNKRRLVPFSEYLPFEGLFPIISEVDLGEGDFSMGKGPMLLKNIKNFTTQICYETVYSTFVREDIAAGSKLIINLTNDGWFKESIEPYQHVSLVKFQAIENGIPIARSANTGITIAYDSYGETIAKTKLYERKTIEVSVPLKSFDTFYYKIGAFVEGVYLWMFILCFLWMLSKAFRQRRQKKKKRVSLKVS